MARQNSIKREKKAHKDENEIRHIKRIYFYESFFQKSLIIAALCLIVLVLAFFVTMVLSSVPSIKSLGFNFIYGKQWNPVTEIFGGLPFLIGTLMTSLLALII